MKAVIIKETGGVEKMELKEINIPTINENEVLINTRAIGVNRIDAFVRLNSFALNIFMQPQKDQDFFILGWDVSGTVVGKGRFVSNFKTGDEVFGMINFFGQGKTYAEYVAAPANQLAAKPGNISHEEASAACLAALTALQSLVIYGQLKPGEKVLIHAAAGGVGHYAIQIAKHLGAYVIGTGSAENKDFITSLGADVFIDYNTQIFETIVDDADLAIDPLPDDHLHRTIKAVKKGGRIIALLNLLKNAETIRLLNEKNIFVHKLVVKPNALDMETIANWLERKIIRSHISQIFSFDDVQKAHQQIESGKTRGKIVITMKNNPNHQ